MKKLLLILIVGGAIASCSSKPCQYCGGKDHDIHIGTSCDEYNEYKVKLWELRNYNKD